MPSWSTEDVASMYSGYEADQCIGTGTTCFISYPINMLSRSSLRISMNWPDLTLSTSFCGKGLGIGDRASF